MSKVKDLDLKDVGKLKMDWAESRMRVLQSFVEEYSKKRPLAGIKIGMSLHLEAKTAVLAKGLQRLGADVSITSSNPITAQDDVAAALTDFVSHVYAWRNENTTEYEENHKAILVDGPNIIIDDGADLSAMAIEDKRYDSIWGVAEETTTGVKRLKAMERKGVLKFPVIAVNDAKGKYLYDNRFGSGQSVLDGVIRSTNMMVGGKQIIVIGYGWVGRGVASRFRGVGGIVTVVEVDPYRVLEAHFDGYNVDTMINAAKYGDIFITCTGNIDIISKEHFRNMKDGSILANAGHFDVEVDVNSLEAISTSMKEVRPNVREYTLENSRRLYLLAEGRLVNLGAGDGHPIEIMDLTFGLQLQSVLYLAEKHGSMEYRVYNVPDGIDALTVKRFLELREINYDKLTDAQIDYSNSWKS